MWQLGDVERARELITWATQRAAEIAHIGAIAHSLFWKSYLEIWRGDPLATLSAAEALKVVAREHDIIQYFNEAELHSGWARGRINDPTAGAAEVRRVLAAFVDQGVRVNLGFYTGLLAELEAETLGADSALARIDEAFALSNQVEHRCSLPFLHRLRGQFLLKRDPADPAPAEEALRTAIALAKEQGARSPHLQAALALAKLYQSTGRPADAHAVLAPALDGFAPTPEMPEIAEAQALLTALGVTDEVQAASASRERRLHLHTAYSEAMMWSKGHAAEETRAALARAAELAGRTDDFAERFTALQGQWAAAATAGELRSARELASTLLREAGVPGRMKEAGIASGWLGMVAYWHGDFVEARTHYERALAVCDPNPDPKDRERYGDLGAWITSTFAATLWQLGEVERARGLINSATRRVSEVGHIASIADALFWKSYLEIWRGDPLATLSAAESLEAVAREHGMAQYLNEAELHLGWARGRINDPIAGAAEVRRVLAAFVDQGVRVNLGLYSGLLAELEAETLGADSALARVDEALGLSNQVENRCSLPFLHRLRGGILLKRDPPAPAPAEEAFRTAIAIAKEQGARSPHLQAALALAKLYQSTGRPVEAHAVLAPALEGFAPTPEMPEIAEAESLLAALSQTDQVKAEAARRQRQQRLHVAYGNALFAARGFGSPEAAEAFARARESAPSDTDAPERSATDYGLFAISYVRGDLPSMRAHAAASLNEVEARPDSPEAGVAHRLAGLTCWFAGEYSEARDHFERALALFQPGRDDDLAFRFGHDAGVAAMLYLSITLWPLGEVARAISLVDSAQLRIARVTHTGSHAFAKMHAAMFELMRRDQARTASIAYDLMSLTRDHDLPMWGTFGVFLDGWATTASGAPADGLAGMRRGAEILREQNVLLFDGLLKIALAEAEAQEGDFDRALGVLDDALAAADRSGYRAFEAELHRARGDMLLRRDPANPAPAQDALLSAIAVAKRQGTRSFALRAALSLAKLYQSTDRPVDAHVVLAPVFEVLSLTPEMPEIAEAQALLAALSEMEEVKSAEGQRQRLLHLQTAYGQAMMMARGFAAEETKAAFARAATLSAKTDDFAERFVACHGQWTLALVRGEQRRVRELAFPLLKEAEDTGRVLEASVARRSLALSCLFSANFLEARTHCERALGACDPERDRETSRTLHRRHRDLGVVLPRRDIVGIGRA